MTTQSELAALDAAARKIADDIAYYSGGSRINVPLLELQSWLLDLYRANKLVLVPSVESVARTLYEADDPWHKVWPWPGLHPDHTAADKYRDIARAVLASMGAKTDG